MVKELKSSLNLIQIKFEHSNVHSDNYKKTIVKSMTIKPNDYNTTLETLKSAIEGKKLDNKTSEVNNTVNSVPVGSSKGFFSKIFGI